METGAVKTGLNDGDYFHYSIKRPYRWNNVKDHWATRAASPAEIAAGWEKVDIIWPVETDDYIQNAIKLVVKDASCIANLENYFLFRQGENTFECVLKFQGKSK